MAEFQLPSFFDYPPYFTLQPVAETRGKQLALWAELVVQYCRHHRLFEASTADDGFPLWRNDSIGRVLARDARTAVVEYLAAEKPPRAEWATPSGAAGGRCVVLWKTHAEWADALVEWARETGQEDAVVTLNELRDAPEARDAPFAGAPEALLVGAVRHLEALGKARLFTGGSGDDTGVKFSC